jgi:hypothetical protein
MLTNNMRVLAPSKHLLLGRLQRCCCVGVRKAAQAPVKLKPAVTQAADGKTL